MRAVAFTSISLTGCDCIDGEARDLQMLTLPVANGWFGTIHFLSVKTVRKGCSDSIMNSKFLTPNPSVQIQYERILINIHHD